MSENISYKIFEIKNPSISQYNCCVKNCDEYFKDRIKDFHYFPKNKERKLKWMELTGIKETDWKTRICDIHFTSKDYGSTRLSCNAYPTLYLNIVLEKPVELKSETELGNYEIQESANITENQKLLEDKDLMKPLSMEIDIKPQLLENVEVDPLQNSGVTEEIQIEDQAEIQDSPEETCRICLKNEDSMIRLFDLHETKRTVAGLYKFCTGLKVQETDGFPQHVCKKCFCKLEEACQLKKEAIESYKTLKSRFVADQKMIEDEELSKETFDTEEIEKPPEALQPPESLDDKQKVPLEEFDKKPEEDSDEREDYLEDFLESTSYDQNYQESDGEADKSKESSTQQKSRMKKINKFYCDICAKDVKVNKLYHLTQHKKNGAKPIKVCDICERQFYLKADVVDHYCRPSIRNCEPCAITFETSINFRKHLEEVHFENGIYVCKEPDCNVKSSSVPSVYQHIRVHRYKLEMLRICDICGMKFTSSSRFSIHMKRHKYPRKPENLICDLCGIKISAKANLIRHMHSVHLKIMEHCDMCPRTFLSKTTLKSHKIKVHNMETTVKCKMCNRKFQFLSQLKLHLQTSVFDGNEECKPPRSGQQKMKQRKCEICNRVFSRYTNLWKHRKIVHEKVRPFSCKICEKKFSQKTQLETHTRIHTGEKPYKCKLCDVKYSDPSTLYKHMKSKHPGEIQIKSRKKYNS